MVSFIPIVLMEIGKWNCINWWLEYVVEKNQTILCLYQKITWKEFGLDFRMSFNN